MTSRTHVPTKRNVNIELLRIFAMLLIVACHGIIHINWNVHHYNMVLQQVPGWKNAFEFLVVQYGQVGVSIFFIISGYFLVKKNFQWKRLFSTWIQTFIYSVGLFVVFFIFYYFQRSDIFQPLFTRDNIASTILWSFIPFTYNSYWFITAYLIMLILSPYINIIVNTASKRENEKLIYILFALGSTVVLFGRNDNWNNVVYALLGYIIGAMLNIHKEEYRHKLSKLFIYLAIVGITILMTLFNYVSSSMPSISSLLGWQSQIHQGLRIGPIVIASLLFYLVIYSKNINLATNMQQFVLNIAKSTFGVYLIHENIFGFRIVWELVSRLAPTPSNIFIAALEFIFLIVITFCVLTVMSFCIDKFIVKPIRSIFRI